MLTGPYYTHKFGRRDLVLARFRRRILMRLRTFRFLTVSIACLVTLAGCNRSNNAEVAQAKAEAEAARAEANAAKAELAKVSGELAKANAELAKLKTAPADKPKSDPDRRAAEWALKHGLRAHVSLRGEATDIKSMEEVRDAPFRVLVIATKTRSNPLINDASLENLAGLADLTAVTFEGCKITGSGLKHLVDCRSLRHVNFNFSPLEDQGIQYLTRLPKLDTLWITGQKVTDASAEHFSQMKGLRSLSLSQTQITDATLKRLEEMPNLQELNVIDTKVTEAGVNHFKAARPKAVVITK
jgi:hypothetical protein